MIVTCENCDTNFNLDESLVKITGSKVRCSKCKHIFTTYPPKPSGGEALAASDDLESAIESDLDTGTTGDSNFSDEQMIDETPSETDEPDDLDLSDIEKMLDVEEDAEEDMATEDDPTFDGPDDDAGDDSLDLSDIEKILDEEELGDDLPEDKTDEDQDLVFDLDEALETEAGEDQLSPTSELDLGDLEKMFESEDEELDFSLDDEPPLSHELEAGDDDNALLSTKEDDTSEDLEIEMEGQASAPESEESEETLDFDMAPVEEGEDLQLPSEEEAPALLSSEEDDKFENLGIEMEGQASTLESEESEETLDFDLEPVEESEALQLPSEEDAPELDFDLEDAAGDLLEEPDIKTPDSGSDMDIELEMEEEAESVISEIGETDMSAEDGSSEVSGLDDALETEEISDDFLDSISEEEEDFSDGAEKDELDEPQEDSFGGPDDEAPDEDLSDLDEEAELDFPDDAVPDIPDEEDVLMDEEESIQEEDLEGGEDVSGEISQPAEDKSGSKKIVVGLLAIVAVIAIVLAAVSLIVLQRKGIVNVPYLDQLPFLGKLKAPEAPDLGNLDIVVTSEKDARFLEGGKAGTLFIVTGKAKNDYSHPRSYIQVSCSLYTRGAILARTVKAYCGNVVSDLELLKMEAPEIQARMENRSGELNSNVGIKPGEERPFMIVFSDYPESLEEYTLTVVGSSADGE